MSSSSRIVFSLRIPPPNSHDRFTALRIDATTERFRRPAIAGPVEIDEVEISGPPFGPLLRHGDGIFAENRFAIIVTLLEADAFASTQVDCRPDFHPLQAPDQAPGLSDETVILH